MGKKIKGGKKRKKGNLGKFGENTVQLGGDISGGKKAGAEKIFSNLTKVRMLNKTVEIISLQHYSF